MEIEGKIIMDLPLQEGVSKAGNAWKKKEWVLETQGQYPRRVKFDFFGDRADTNRLEIGKTYVISFDLESREFNGRWYTDVRAFASRESGMQQMQAPGAQYAQPAAPQQPFGAQPAAAPFAAPSQTDQSDDLPF